jgi:hypothetical protein
MALERRRRHVHNRFGPGPWKPRPFSSRTFDPNGRREWISIASFGPTRVPDIKELAKRVIIAPEFLEHARDNFAGDDAYRH